MLVRAARRAAVASAAGPRRCTARRTSTVGDNRVVRLQTEDPRMSKIVIHNGVVYTSGQTAGDAGDCVKAQTQATLDKVDALLKEAGTSKSHALSATIWLKDINRDFKAMNGEWNAWVDPVRNGVEKKTTNVGAVESLLGTGQGCPSRDNAQIGGPLNVFAVRSSSIREHTSFASQVNKPVRATVESPLATPLMLVEIQVTAAIA